MNDRFIDGPCRLNSKVPPIRLREIFFPSPARSTGQLQPRIQRSAPAGHPIQCGGAGRCSSGQRYPTTRLPPGRLAKLCRPGRPSKGFLSSNNPTRLGIFGATAPERGLKMTADHGRADRLWRVKAADGFGDDFRRAEPVKCTHRKVTSRRSAVLIQSLWDLLQTIEPRSVALGRRKPWTEA
jgi:hypothetical protein